MTAPTTAALARADAELMRLESAAATVAANLVELDDNTARQDLDRGPLAGRTATAWAGAAEALGRLWDGYALLSALIDEARAVRRQRRLTDGARATYLHQVLGPSITLSTATVPLAQRGLLGAGRVSTTCTPAELLSAMESAFATAAGVAGRAADVWHRMLPATADAAARLATVRGLTGGSGAGPALLDEADRRLGALTAALAADPLGFDEKGLAAVCALIDRADAERTSAAELRETLTQRLADAHALAAELAAAAGAAAAAESAAAGRFAGAAVVPVRGPDLRPDLAAIDALAAAGHWGLIGGRLAGWTRQARERLAQLHQAAARNTALLADRNELRGRLDAYRAKAARRGLGDRPELTARAEAARAALDAVPCDLVAARVAVTAYQEAVARGVPG